MRGEKSVWKITSLFLVVLCLAFMTGYAFRTLGDTRRFDARYDFSISAGWSTEWVYHWINFDPQNPPDLPETATAQITVSRDGLYEIFAVSLVRDDYTSAARMILNFKPGGKFSLAENDPRVNSVQADAAAGKVMASVDLFEKDLGHVHGIYFLGRYEMEADESYEFMVTTEGMTHSGIMATPWLFVNGPHAAETPPNYLNLYKAVPASLRAGLPPPLSVRPSVHAEDGKKVEVAVELNLPAAESPEARAQVKVFRIDGKVVAESSCMLNSEIELALPDGMYRTEAHVDGLYGHEVMVKGEEALVVGENPREVVEDETEGIILRARMMKGNPAMEAYAGWFDYLTRQVNHKLAPELPRFLQCPQTASPPEPETVSVEIARLAFKLSRWLARAEHDPMSLTKLRGEQEWAYLSKVDGTGQPFTIVIPKDYDPNRAYPLHIRLHSYGATYKSYKVDADAAPESTSFHLLVMGRTHGSGYVGLGEIDVLEALDYVKEHWNIDPSRIHLSGGSMGGGGVFKLASRHPHLFASGRSWCGYGLGVPLENMLHVPTYAIHSNDDSYVPISMVRAPLRLLGGKGGKVVRDETDGYDHHVLRYTEGNIRSSDWAYRQVRPQKVSRVYYTAIDELAREAYWVQIVEWGPEGRPATINARLGMDNTLYLNLDNVRVARIDLAASPADSSQKMTVVINDKIMELLEPAPPRSLFIIHQNEGWNIVTEAPPVPRERLHFPGGAMALFHGEPLLVVWGTRADEETNKKILRVAEAARRSPAPSWPEKTSFDPDGLPMNYMFWGKLPGKPDHEVTRSEMEKYNLLLIGTAEQNSVVAKIAKKLPVKIKDGRVTTDDGFSWKFKDRALGLLYYNPIVPRRLIYWVGSESPEFYKLGTLLMESQSWYVATPDFILMGATKSVRVAARRFDSRWHWEPGYSQSRVMPEAFGSHTGFTAMVGEAIRREVGADFALVQADWSSKEPAWAAGETRLMDVIAWEYDERLASMELTGEELLTYHKELSKESEGESCRFLPTPSPEDIDPKCLYRVAMRPSSIGDFARKTRTNPESFRLVDLTVREALLHQLGKVSFD